MCGEHGRCFDRPGCAPACPCGGRALAARGKRGAAPAPGRPPWRRYSALVRAGITTVSIGHRPALRRFHSVAVHFGEGGTGHYSIEQLRGSDAEGLAEADLPGL